MSKIEKIKAKIERRYEYWKEKESNSHSIESESRMSECNHLLSMIISLSDTEKDFGIKESVIPFGVSDSELMEATYFIPQGYHAVIEGNKVIIKKCEEPVSNDLEEAAHSYVDTTIEWFDSESNPCCYPAFIAGAQWQKEHLEMNRIKHCDNITEDQYNLESDFLDDFIDKHDRIPTFLDAIEYGMKLQKEQDQSTIELAEDHAYLAGQEKIIDNACEFLRSHIDRQLVIYHEHTWRSRDEFIEGFKKAMEE